MQTHTDITNTSEARWCNVDQFLHETVSSTCAVVGFFVGYSVTLPSDTHRALPISPGAGGVVRGLEYIAAALPRGQCGSEEQTVGRCVSEQQVQISRAQSNGSGGSGLWCLRPGLLCAPKHVAMSYGLAQAVACIDTSI